MLAFSPWLLGLMEKGEKMIDQNLDVLSFAVLNSFGRYGFLTTWVEKTGKNEVC